MTERTTSIQIEINDLEMMVHIGVGEQERSEAQPIRFDVVLTLETSLENRNDPLDELSSSVDYVAVLEIVDELVGTGPKRKLLETLANDIARRCLALPKVERVEVAVTKLLPPVPFELRSVSARLKLAKLPDE
ncbi:MAG: dihydroneopterin aldolase [Acidimicrobiaceae bacterium]|nr:dihydroneopterin aldolase [Acidimicrobiaceae bacterium]